MSQHQQIKKIGLVAAICGSLVISLPAIAQVRNNAPDPNRPAANTDPGASENRNPGVNTSPANRVNTNPGRNSNAPNPNRPAANTDPGASENRNPGINTSPANRINNNPGRTNSNAPNPNRPAANTDPRAPENRNPGVNTSPENRVNNATPGQSGDMMNRGNMNQMEMNRQRTMSPDGLTPSSMDGMDRMNSGAALNPCPSIFYEPKYVSLGIRPPAGCPSVSP